MSAQEFHAVPLHAGNSLPPQSDPEAQNAHAVFYKDLSDAEGARGLYVAREGNTFAAVAPVGAVMMWLTDMPPLGWLVCDGSAISRSAYADLFTLFGTTYGAGDGSTTFNLPDMRGRVPVGVDSTQPEFNAVGNSGGEKTHTLTQAEMPSHNHSLSRYSSTTGSSSGFSSDTSMSGTLTPVTEATGAAGSDGAHNNLQPYLALVFIVKA